MKEPQAYLWNALAVFNIALFWFVASGVTAVVVSPKVNRRHVYDWFALGMFGVLIGGYATAITCAMIGEHRKFLKRW